MESEYIYCPLCGSPLETTPIDNVLRKKCSASECNFVFWNNPVPVVAALVEYENKIILARNKLWPRDWYALIAGFLEKGETPETAIVREIKEELDLDCALKEFVGYYSFFEMNQLLLVYHAIATPGTITLSDELDDYKLVKPEEIVPWEKGTGPAVRDWLERRNTVQLRKH